MSIERKVLADNRSRLDNDLRRREYPLLGPESDPANDSLGRAWPEDNLLPWIRQEASVVRMNGEKVADRPYLDNIRSQYKAITQIFGVNSFHKIREIVNNKSLLNEKKTEIESNVIRAFATRHNILLTDDPEPETGKFEGLKLPFTQKREPLQMTTDKFRRLLDSSLDAAKATIQTIENKDNGILAEAHNFYPGPVNEPKVFSLADQLIMTFDKNAVPQARYEARRNIVFSDGHLEILLHKPEVQEVREQFTKIYGNYLFKERGPDLKVRSKVLVNPSNFSVEGVEIIPENEKTGPRPNQLLEVYRMRESLSGIPVQIDEDLKSDSSMMLKMLRKDTLDPSTIHDFYRTEAIFMHRRDIDRFIDEINEACILAGKPLIGTSVEQIEENTLDGGKYEAKGGDEGPNAGSVEQYQVMRIKLTFADHPDVPFEMSAYTIEAHTNYRNRDGLSVPEYQLARLLKYKKNKVNGSVLDYTHPHDIWNYDFVAFGQRQAFNIRRKMRDEPFVHDAETHTKVLKRFAELDKKHAAQTIIGQMEKRQKESSENLIPETIIVIDKNTVAVAADIRKHFGDTAEIYVWDKNSGNSRTLPEVVEFYKMLAPNDRILIIDSIGDNAHLIAQVRSFEPNNNVDYSVLALKEDSPAETFVNYYGTTFKDEYLVFPQDEVADISKKQAVYALITRINNGNKQILLQHEKGNIYTIPGGTNDPVLDDNTLETLRRELAEEVGEENKKEISRNLVQQFPIDVDAEIANGNGNSPANTLNLRGYIVDGSNLNLNPESIPEDSEVLNLVWVNLGVAVQMVESRKKGYQKLIKSLEDKTVPLEVQIGSMHKSKAVLYSYTD